MEKILTPQQYFRSHTTRPRKWLGQHFLIQPGTAERIVESAELQASDLVVEVGPGLGALTRFIAPEVGIVHLIELDRDLAEYLKTRSFPSNCQVYIHQQDVLDFDFQALSEAQRQPLVLLGNLPYNISSPLIFHLLESPASFHRAVLMMQKEVGQRLTAKPGTKDYGVLSVLLRVFAQTKRLFTVGPGQFYPPPKVDSMVIRIDFEKEPAVKGLSLAFLKKVVNTAFQKRRKTLYNSLKSLEGVQKEMLDTVFSRTGIDPRRRPETLEWQEFVQLSEALNVCGGTGQP